MELELGQSADHQARVRWGEFVAVVDDVARVGLRRPT